MNIADASEQPPRGFSLWFDNVSIVGERFRPDDCMAYMRGAVEALRARRKFGIRLRRQPDNEADSYAIAVFGYVKGGFLRPEQVFHLGYIAKKLAYRIGKTGGARPLAARLVDFEIREGEGYEDDPLNIIIDIYIQGQSPG